MNAFLREEADPLGGCKTCSHCFHLRVDNCLFHFRGSSSSLLNDAPMASKSSVFSYEFTLYSREIA